jgi:uncharacterized membrane protein YhiD involved in acid resistance
MQPSSSLVDILFLRLDVRLRNAALVHLALVVWLVSSLPTGTLSAQPDPAQEESAERAVTSIGSEVSSAVTNWRQELLGAVPRLPLAALLGMALALRPKRKGTPTRTPAVVQTQIILAVVGAVIMLVVGASLARAFGIVGAANLIRYRSKIDDPKDAGVMLCCLAVGLAAGVGLYALAIFSTAFIVVALAAIESFEPARAKSFVLKVTKGHDAPDLRSRLEETLERHQIEHSLRTTSNEELAYDVKVPFEVETDRVTNTILRLEPDDTLAVTWDDKQKAR